MKIYNTEGNLDSDVQDALIELCNAGTGMVSITIGRLLNVRVSISTPHLKSLKEEVILPPGDDANSDAVAVFMHMTDAISGEVVFIINKDFVVSAVERITGKHYSFDTMMDDECSFSVVQEFGNIIGSAYVKAIGGYTGIRFYLSPVMVGIDKVQGLLSSAYLRGTQKNDQKICVESEFFMVDKDDKSMGQVGHIVMMPDADSVEKLMGALGI